MHYISSDKNCMHYVSFDKYYYDVTNEFVLFQAYLLDKLEWPPGQHSESLPLWLEDWEYCHHQHTYTKRTNARPQVSILFNSTKYNYYMYMWHKTDCIVL